MGDDLAVLKLWPPLLLQEVESRHTQAEAQRAVERTLRQRKLQVHRGSTNVLLRTMVPRPMSQKVPVPNISQILFSTLEQLEGGRGKTTDFF
jgi:hypothetical protein